MKASGAAKPDKGGIAAVSTGASSLPPLAEQIADPDAVVGRSVGALGHEQERALGVGGHALPFRSLLVWQGRHAVMIGR